MRQHCLVSNHKTTRSIDRTFECFDDQGRRPLPVFLRQIRYHTFDRALLRTQLIEDVCRIKIEVHLV